METLLIKKKAKILFYFITVCCLAMFMDAYAQISYVQNELPQNSQSVINPQKASQPQSGTQETSPSPTQTLPGQGALPVAATSSSFVVDLSQQTNCKPQLEVTCEATVNTSTEFLTFLNHCNELKGWLIHFKPSTSMQFTIVGGATLGCDISVVDNQIKDQSRNMLCKISQEQLQQMTSASSIKIVQAYEKDRTNNTDFLALGKPILDCIGPPLKVTEIVEIQR